MKVAEKITKRPFGSHLLESNLNLVDDVQLVAGLGFGEPSSLSLLFLSSGAGVG